MKKLIDLGGCIGELNIWRKNGFLTIYSQSGCDEGFYKPAESVTITGEAQIIALRDALNEAYPPETS